MGILRSLARAETLSFGKGRAAAERATAAPEEAAGGMRAQPGARARRWDPAGPSPPGVRFPPSGSRARRDPRRLLAPLPETRPPSPPRRSLRDLRELVARFPAAGVRRGSAEEREALPCGSLGPERWLLAAGLRAPAPSSYPRLLGSLNSGWSKVRVCLCSLL